MNESKVPDGIRTHSRKKCAFEHFFFKHERAPELNDRPAFRTLVELLPGMKESKVSDNFRTNSAE
jgi:hypothetical protein